MPTTDSDTVKTCDFCCVLRRTFLVGWLTFAGFTVVWLTFFGGLSAMNGKVVDRLHYIGGHGEYRVVSEPLYDLMLALEKLVISVFVAGSLAAVVNNSVKDCRDRAKNRLWPW